MKLTERIRAATDSIVPRCTLTKDALQFVRLALKTTEDSDPFQEATEQFATYEADGEACAKRVYEELSITRDTGSYDETTLYFETSAADPDKARKEAFVSRAAYQVNRYYANPTETIRRDAFPEATTALTSADKEHLLGQLDQIFDYLRARRIRRFVRSLELDVSTATNPIEAMKPYGKEATLLGLSDYLLARRDQLLTK